ncbi:Elongator subunit elp2 [Coemansia sp. BCRC 34301]|nr:Elongator subunit elp2 [Coemansia sp. BCRC 34301]
MVSAKPELISTACSRTAHALDWGTESLVAFGADTAVALYDPTDAQGPGIHTTLQGHTKRVNCVRFVRTVSGTPVSSLVSASADCTARVWRHDSQAWDCVAVLEGHLNPVISAASVQLEDGRIIAVTASTDGTLRVFELQSDNASTCVQTVDVGSRSAIDVTLTVLPDCSAIVLATGNTDNCVYLYTRTQQPGSQFTKALKLTGHEDWVTAVSFLQYQGAGQDNLTISHWQVGDLVLASASEDKYVRLWRISQAATPKAAASLDSDKLAAQAMLDAFASTGDSLAAAQLSTRAHVMAVESGSGESRSYLASLDSVLIGHDGWVHSVSWTHANGLPALVSASADSSAIVWAPDANAGVWSSVARLGEAGGATQGFLGSAVSPSGTLVLAHGYQGSLHMWCTDGSGLWIPRASVSGHYASVQDVCWDPNGNYLLSVSADQTARLFAPLQGGWREISRPQVHGYDMRCAAFVAPYVYVSGADEKVLRVFTATQQFASAWQTLVPGAIVPEFTGLAVGASLPVLGLSNKAVDEEQVRTLQEAEGNERDDSYYIRQTHTDVVANAAMRNTSGGEGGEPPLEEHLLRHTLWPETDKLYGHPYEIFAVAAAHSGDWIATACKASSEKYAAIRMYSAHTWQPPTVRGADNEPVAATPLSAHSLTITRMRFSPPSDKWLLSVSRDRSWTLFEKTATGSEENEVFGVPTGPYRLAHHQAKAHARIIWDAAWSPDARFFATASRDKSIKLWPTPSSATAYAGKPVVLTFSESVTAVDFFPEVVQGQKYALAVGLENGQVLVLTANAVEEGAAVLIPGQWDTFEVSRKDAHVAMVHRLAWRPKVSSNDGCSEWKLASASDDQSVRIFSIVL